MFSFGIGVPDQQGTPAAPPAPQVVGLYSPLLYRTQSVCSLGYEKLHLVPTGFIKESRYQEQPSTFYTIDSQRRRVEAYILARTIHSSR